VTDLAAYGAHATLVDGVVFVEGPLWVPADPLGPVNVRIDRQNANLTIVKQRLAAMAKSRGADAIAAFTYGQRAHKWYERFRWDEEAWHGEGTLHRVRR
jgi:hypothetical protein